MMYLFLWIVLLYTIDATQVEPSLSSPTLRSPLSVRRKLRGKSSKGSKGPTQANILHEEVGDKLPGPLSSAIPFPATTTIATGGDSKESIHMTAASTTERGNDSESSSEETAEVDTPANVHSSAESSSQPPTYFPTLEPSSFPLSASPTDDLTLPSIPALMDDLSIPPSLAPSSFPTMEMSSEPSDIPSSSPFEAGADPSCNLESSVDCRLEDGSPCSNLMIVSQEKTYCSGSAFELEWLYLAGSCNESSTNQPFECQDYNGGPSSVFMAHLTITGLESNEEYSSKFIFQGKNGFPVQSVVVKSASQDSAIDDRIKVVLRKGSPSAGEILQEMTIVTTCNDPGNLRVGDTLGALQLASYRSDETSGSSQAAFADVTWIYSATNVGNTSSVLESMVSGNNRASTTVYPNIELSPGEEYHLVAQETIALTEAKTFRKDLKVWGSNDCFDTSSYAFTI